MISLLLSVFFMTLSQVFSLLGVVLAAGFLLCYLEKLSAAYFCRSFGKRGYLFTSYIGTPVHELGHVLMCWLFRHRVGRVQWFPKDSDEKVLGYVEHSYSKSSVYQRIGNFFVGVGPIISGILALIALMHFFVPASYDVFLQHLQSEVQPGEINGEILIGMLQSSTLLVTSLFTVQNLLSPSFWLFLFLALSVSTHIALSKPDIKGAASGIVSIFTLLFALNLTGALLGYDISEYVTAIAGYNAYLLAFASLAVLFSLITLGICFSLYVVRRKTSRRANSGGNRSFPHSRDPEYGE